MAAVGALDPTFDQNGIVTAPLVPGLGLGGSGQAVVESGHGLLVAGWLVPPDQDPAAAILIARYQANGHLDPAFGGGNGFVMSGFGEDVDTKAFAIALQHDDGKIVVGGFYDPVEFVSIFGLMRFLHDGGVDSDFGNGGLVTTDFGTDIPAYCTGLGVQADGRIVAGGFAFTTPTSNRSAFALTRYERDGSLDTSFGNSGRVLTRIGSTAVATGLAIQPDGKIVVGGYTDLRLPFAPTNDYRFALARYGSNGTLDASFGAGGKMATRIGGWAAANAVALDQSNRIVLAGSTHVGNYERVALARYNPNGFLDTSFGQGGVTYTRFPDKGDAANAVAIQPTDGKIVIAGRAAIAPPVPSGPPPYPPHFAFARFNADGSSDTTFGVPPPTGIWGIGGNGKIALEVPTPSAIGQPFEDIAYGLVIQHDGRLVGAGGATAMAGSAFAVVRLN